MTSPWRTTAEAAEYWRLFRKDGALDLKAARKRIDREIPRERVRKLGRSVRVHQDDLDAVLRVRTT